MRPVNLLPEQLRPARPSGQRSGSAYGVLAVLSVLLVLVAVYVVTANQVGDRKTELAQAKRETAAAEATVARFGPVGRFLSIKETREQTVKQLAEARFDQERLVRELARVLPEKVFLTEAKFAVSALAASNAGAVPTASATATPPAGPTLTLAGCAESQPAVAVTLVRLRKLYRSADVTLTESADSSKSGASPAPGVSTSAGSGEEGCGKYAFTATVAFDDASAAPEPKRVPASLGGGA